MELALVLVSLLIGAVKGLIMGFSVMVGALLAARMVKL